jgi:C1A family cysteine protease
MVAVGYDEARKALRIQNSWGRSWGDGGRGWFSYDFWRSRVKAGFVID